MNCTLTIQSIVDYARTYASLTEVLGNPASGYGGSAPALNIANEVISEIKAEPFAWKWNRKMAPAFCVNQYQSDYSTSIADLGWLENATKQDTSSTVTPQPIRGMEVVRELRQTNVQGTPFQLSWVYNSEAICGTWAPHVTYSLAPNLPSCPNQPLTQIRDSNGNIQVVTTNGTTGNTQPTWATTPGQTTTDGTVVWTCINPNGITFRVSPLPPQGGHVWLVQPYYQQKPALITGISQTWGIPDELAYVYRQGFIAKAFKAAEDDRWTREYAAFEAMLQKAVGASDREQESFSMYPSRGLQYSAARGPADFDGVPPGTF